ncbi:hypothetical protein GQ43DRAFT_97194 [Delitschia confertaspora ATCC 74209]|uniref:Uncharacterized protein n=1 Tax=Delitschia confertaspora ATCC 74209 TaxID=1513339 RepID=A0A9P4MRI3_9PLEO|nr:hypothetical protein GQ43DRAFT_97194 [Delitschia confertaspora ATCC 74209]
MYGKLLFTLSIPYPRDSILTHPLVLLQDLHFQLYPYISSQAYAHSSLFVNNRSLSYPNTLFCPLMCTLVFISSEYPYLSTHAPLPLSPSESETHSPPPPLLPQSHHQRYNDQYVPLPYSNPPPHIRARPTSRASPALLCTMAKNQIRRRIH